MVFKHSDEKAEYHAVFPKGVTAPRENELTKALVLHGRFEAIRSTLDNKPLEKPARPVKGIPYGYRYFVVSGWEIEK